MVINLIMFVCCIFEGFEILGFCEGLMYMMKEYEI